MWWDGNIRYCIKVHKKTARKKKATTTGNKNNKLSLNKEKAINESKTYKNSNKLLQ